MEAYKISRTKYYLIPVYSCLSKITLGQIFYHIICNILSPNQLWLSKFFFLFTYYFNNMA